MARQKKDEVVQPPLVPLTEEEIAELQKNLPVWIGQLEEMKTRHAGVRAELKEERSELQKKINNGAQQLRMQGR